jgi:hypothetical protein
MLQRFHLLVYPDPRRWEWRDRAPDKAARETAFDKLFPALALVFHLVDCAAQGIRGPVTKEAALRAAAWCEYLEPP